MFIKAITCLESVLESDSLRDLKRKDFIGKLQSSDCQMDMLAELGELLFLVERVSEVRYAPEFPSAGPDFGFRIASRWIELEVTRLSGTNSSWRNSRFREDLDVNLLSVPSGLSVTLNCEWIDSVEAQAAAFRVLKKWLASKPMENSAELATQFGTLEVRVFQRGLDPSHTVVAGHGWSNHDRDERTKQFINSMRRKAGQLTDRCPSAIIVWTDLEYFALDPEGALRDSGYFRNHPSVSAVIFKGFAPQGGTRRAIVNLRPNRALTADELAVLSGMDDSASRAAQLEEDA